jgi:Holliday junction resolvase-like predicted endonuclease
MGNTALNWYQVELDRLAADGQSMEACATHLADAYLDGKPRQQGKHSITQRERDRQFWSLGFWRSCPTTIWSTGSLGLALTRYMAQDAIAAPDLLNLVSQAAPETVIRAVRHSSLVTNQTSPRRTELDAAADLSPEIHELCQVLTIFEEAHTERRSHLQFLRTEFEETSAFELLLLSSLYAFKHQLPGRLDPTAPAAVHSDEVVWDAVNDLLIWKLQTHPEDTLRLNDQKIGSAMGALLKPLLFGDAGEDSALERLTQFESLMDIQIELNEFLSRSSESFSYNDAIRFVRRIDHLDIVEVIPAVRTKWEANGRKQELLHGYWFYRALDAFAELGIAGQQIGSSENHDANQLAWISALRAQMQLSEIYGVSDQIKLTSGEKVDVFRALLSLELMSAQSLQDFLGRYTTLLAIRGDWRLALRDLALEGLSNGMQIRFPLTWSDRDAKISNITSWTVSTEHPRGNPRMASSILDFWSYDMQEIASQQRAALPGLTPRLYERPVLKFGSTFVQLPWIVGIQNRSTAAINNLRRLGSRRTEAARETRQIEERLASLLRSRGFQVVLNWDPPAPWRDAGEVDVIAARDGHLFVFEVKSTFVRRSLRDAWLHATSTLRKAGRQVEKKLRAVAAAVESGLLMEQLGLAAPVPVFEVHGWIVDTSIECDHDHFSRHLKVSLEEMLIALRDDAHLLSAPDGLISESSQGTREGDRVGTLYPEGFSATRFVEVIQGAEIWSGLL